MPLNGWKEIAGYIGRGVRTAQRWESSYALPVHRPAGAPRSAVFAVESELDVWLKTAPLYAGNEADLQVLEERLEQLEAECERLRRLIESKRIAPMATAS
jgi:hypothetical protein